METSIASLMPPARRWARYRPGTPCIPASRCWRRRQRASASSGRSPSWPAPMKPQCSGMPTMCTVLPSQISGLIRLVTTALALHRAAVRPDPHPAAVVDAFLLGELLGDLDEEFRLQHGVDPDVLGPEVEVLGQPVGGRRIGELLGVAELLHIVLEHARDRIAADLRRDRDWRSAIRTARNAPGTARRASCRG